MPHRIDHSLIGLCLLVCMTVLSCAPKNSGESMVETSNLITGLGFYIDPYESSIKNGFAISKKGEKPAYKITFATAKSACEKSGKRLCTPEELISACYGPNLTAFSVQDEQDGLDTLCNVKAPTEEEEEEKFQSVMSPHFWSNSRIKNPRIRTAEEDSSSSSETAPKLAGEHPKCKTDGLEVYDLVGNVTEWSDSSESDDFTQDGAAIGTSFATSADALASVATYCGVQALNGDSEPYSLTSKEPSVGFRCCSDELPPDPFEPSFPYKGD